MNLGTEKQWLTANLLVEACAVVRVLVIAGYIAIHHVVEFAT